MKPTVLAGLLSTAMALIAVADEPAPAAKNDVCLMFDNRILGPRSGDRPLPLLAGDPQHGFHPACAVPWSTLSPANKPLAVVGCFKGNLLQVENAAACGTHTGPLWVSSRWVLTSAELHQPQKRVAMCQQLETNAWAGTRDFNLDCEARKKELSADSAPPGKPPAPSPSADKPAAGPPPK
jgi:hypothetical protein